MAKFRKKPVVIEANQFNAGSRAYPDGVCYCGSPSGAHVHTLEGPLAVSDKDWIITGVKGEKYPCKPDIFAATYDAVEFDKKRPTIEELERILAQNPEGVGIQLNSDGSLTAVNKV